MTHAAERFRYLYETLMAGTDTHVYFSVIPDKNHFLAEANGYPALDYQALTDALRKQTEFAAYIDLFGTLTADDYYRTDSHWQQENLLTAADTCLMLSMIILSSLQKIRLLCLPISSMTSVL